MKTQKLLAFITASIIALSLISCGGSNHDQLEEPASTDEPIQINLDNQVELDNGVYILEPEPEEIAEEEGISYIKGEVLLYAVSGADREAIEALIQDKNGVLVGETPDLDSYQARFQGIRSYTELEELCNELMNSELVEFACPDYVFDSTEDYYPESDAEWSGNWDMDRPGGRNWGVEAIHAPDAWDFRDEMQEVNVGVFDSCFYQHKDLRYTKLFNNDQVSSYHGTHVSGIILAGFDNGIGICGVLPKGNLYGYSILGSGLEGKSYAKQYEVALMQLLVQDKCSAVNISMNTGRRRAYAATHGNAAAELSLQKEAELMTVILKRIDLLQNRFVLCVAAGNVNDKAFVRDTSYGYLVREAAKNDRESDYLPLGTEAVYNNMLNYITDPEVKEHIIVVGSCAHNPIGYYSLSGFCNTGSRVDVIAPGELIYSTVDHNKYKSLNGTSMATPHVTGLAAMLFALDPSLTAGECKQIIIDSAQTPVRGTEEANIETGMIDCSLAMGALWRKIGNDAIDWQTLYAQFLTENLNTELDYCSELRLLYLDDDNIPELGCIMGNSHSSGVRLYAILEGDNVVSLGEYGSFGGTIYCEKQKTVINSYFGQGLGETSVYAFDENWSPIQTAYLYEDPFGTTDGSGQPFYRIGTTADDAYQVDGDAFRERYDQIFNLPGITEITYGDPSVSGHHLMVEDINVILEDPESLFQ